MQVLLNKKNLWTFTLWLHSRNRNFRLKNLLRYLWQKFNGANPIGVSSCLQQSIQGCRLKIKITWASKS